MWNFLYIGIASWYVLWINLRLEIETLRSLLTWLRTELRNRQFD